MDKEERIRELEAVVKRLFRELEETKKEKPAIFEDVDNEFLEDELEGFIQNLDVLPGIEIEPFDVELELHDFELDFTPSDKTVLKLIEDFQGISEVYIKNPKDILRELKNKWIRGE
jgi:hypothetical protein